MNGIVLGHRLFGVPLAVLLLVGALVILALLHALRRPRLRASVVVSFGAFWTRHGAALVRGRQRVAWWLALVAALCAWIAAADPRPVPTARVGRHVVLLLDAALWHAPAGADRVRAAARRVLDTLLPHDRVAIVGFDVWPDLVQGWTSDPDAARAALASWAPPPPPTAERGLPRYKRQDVAGALTFADALTNELDRPEAVVIGPGGYAKEHSTKLPVWWLRTEAASPANVAIVALAATRAADADAVSVWVRLRNDGDHPRTMRLRVLTETVALFDDDVSLAGQEERAVRVTAPAASASGAVIRAEIAVKDAFDSDNAAEVLLAARTPARITIVGKRNRYLEEALSALPRPIKLLYAATWHPAQQQPHVVIFNEYEDTVDAATSGRFIQFAAARSGGTRGRDEPAPLRAPVITSQAEHSVLAHVDLRAVNIREARKLPLSPGGLALVRSYDQPLVTLEQRGSGTWLTFAFSLRQSDLVWRPDFPLLLENALATLAPVASVSAHVLTEPASVRARPHLFASDTSTAHWKAPTETRFFGKLARRPGKFALAVAALFGVTLTMLALRRSTRAATWAAAAGTVAALAALSDVAWPSLREGSEAVIVSETQADARELTRLRQRLAHEGRHASVVWLAPEGPRAKGDVAAMTARQAGLLADARAQMTGAHVFWFADAPAPWAPAARASLWHRSRPSDAAGAALGPIAAPAWIAPNESFEVTMPVAPTKQGHLDVTVVGASARLAGNRAPTATSGSLDVPIQAGTSAVRLAVLGVQPSGARIEARVRPEGGSAVDTATVVSHPFVRRPPHALVLTPNPSSVGALAAALRAQGLQATVQRPHEAAAPDAFDLIVLADVPPAQIRPTYVASLLAAVDKGTGLLVAGGPAAFARGGWRDSPLARALPITMDPPAARPISDLALALIIDRSGSMDGAKIQLTREAARATSTAMKPTDLLMVVAFDSRAETIVPLQSAANRPRIWADLDRLAAGGGTNIMPALQEAYQTLVAAPARRRHVIVLSDGHAPAAQLPALLDKIAAAEITVSAVAVGRGADVGMLRRMTEAGGGRLHVTDDPSRIPRIFTADVAAAHVSQTSDARVRIRARTKADAFASLPWRQAPAIGGVAPVQARASARVLLETTQLEPLLATWNVGEGVVGAFASDVAGPWLAPWVRWGPYPALWAAVARTLSRQDPEATFPIEVEQTQEGPLATIRTRDEPWTGAAGELHIVAAGDVNASALWTTTLRETDPGVYQARLPHTPPPPLAAPAAAWLRARIRSAEGDAAAPLARAFGHVAWDVRAGGSTKLAALGDGSASHTIARAQAQMASTKRPADVPLAPWFAAFAALLFVAAISLTRATFRASKT